MNHSKHPWRHLALLICILLLFIVSPVVVTFRHGILVLNIIGTAVARGMQMRYFSFMTLTTVGYGDVVPRSSAARTMAALEAVMETALSHRPRRAVGRGPHRARERFTLAR